MDTAAERQEYGPWNPGLRSPVPSHIRPLTTLLRPENAVTSLETADELASFSGFRAEEIVKLRPERLVVHEVLVRVSADISVPDGSRYQDLGINFRKIVATILEKYIEPEMTEIVRACSDLDRRLHARIQDELSVSLFNPPVSQSHRSTGGVLRRLLSGGRKFEPPALQQDSAGEERQVLKTWREKEKEAEESEMRVIYQTLIAVADSIRKVHGRIWGDMALITSLVNNLSCNIHGGTLIGEMVAPLIARAVETEGFRLLPVQAKPIVMNTKGASASGKSTLRPLQKELAKELGVDWADFALISPDIWRKHLLDYGSLGAAYKYAGALTSDEVEIIDQKLDAYMAKKADDGRMSHLLIDRFRFDSFAPVSDETAGSTLLTRFGNEVYMFFMITPPEATVERAWTRGEEFGRYKTVDDLLYHNVEAFTGMARLFFTWALKTDKSVHHEFLDNDVPLGERPRTVAFGVNGDMTILDIKKMLDMERYRKINVNAGAPAEVYPDAEKMSAGENVGFLRECARLIPSITFADQDTGRIYGRMEKGVITWTDGDMLARVIQDEDARAGLEALTGAFPASTASETRTLVADDAHTLGQWGKAG